MSILTIEQLKLVFDPSRIEQLASDTNLQFGKITYNAEVVTTIINQVEGSIKNSLSLQYTTSELEADLGIQRMAADIVMYYLELRRPPPSAATKSLYDAALLFLKQLQEGSAKLSAVQQLLPTGPTSEPTEAISTGFFNLTEAEQNSLP